MATHPLQASGQISFDDIRIELDVPSQASFNLRSASVGFYGAIQQCQTPTPNTATPDAISDWYGYNHAATASLTYNFTTEYSPTSCAVACALLDGEDEETLVAYTRNGTLFFGNAVCTTELSPVGYYAVDQTTCYTVTASTISTGSCGTTTTTTTTTLGTGTCYKVVNTSGVNTPTLLWTDRTGTARSGVTAVSTTYYICSIVTPTEQGGAVDLTIDDCTDGGSTPCTVTCTSLACKQCSSNGVCTT